MTTVRRAAIMAASTDLTSAGVVNGIIQDDWDKIIEICNAGRAQEFYGIGAKKQLSCGTAGTYYVAIAGFNVDVKTNFTGTANTSWIALTSATQGAPNLNKISGQATDIYITVVNDLTESWDVSSGEVKTWLATIRSKMPSNVRSNLKTVFKTQGGMPHHGRCFAYPYVTKNDIWIPDMHELLDLQGNGMYQSFSALNLLEAHDILGRTITSKDKSTSYNYDPKASGYMTFRNNVLNRYVSVSSIDSAYLHFGFCL